MAVRSFLHFALEVPDQAVGQKYYQDFGLVDATGGNSAVRLRPARQKRHADLFETCGRRMVPRRGHRLPERPGASIERQSAAERLIEHYPHGVPVGSLRHGRSVALLGRHVRGRPCHAEPDIALREALAARESEVEDHHASARVDQHVGRLEVSMDDAGRVQRADTGRQLSQ